MCAAPAPPPHRTCQDYQLIKNKNEISKNKHNSTARPRSWVVDTWAGSAPQPFTSQQGVGQAASDVARTPKYWSGGTPVWGGCVGTTSTGSLETFVCCCNMDVHQKSLVRVSPAVHDLFDRWWRAKK